MSQQLLDLAHVSATIEQVRREAVTQRVRRDARGQTGGVGRAPHDAPQPLATEAPTTQVHEQCGPAGCDPWTTANEPRIDRVGCGLAEGDDALAVPLPAHPHESIARIEVVDVDADRLGDAQPGAVHELECGPVPQPCRRAVTGGLEQPDDVRDAERTRQGAARRWCCDRRRRIGRHVLLGP